MKAILKTASLVLSIASATGVAHAQVDFFLVGNPTTLASRPTDISFDGRTVVGLDGANSAWRWNRGATLQAMPPLTSGGGACMVASAFVTADGTQVVGDAGGPNCSPWIHHIFRWNAGANPFMDPNGPNLYTYVRGISATGIAAGTQEDFGYFDMFSQTHGTPPYMIYVQGCGLPADYYFTMGTGATPDGVVLGRIYDCDDVNGGIIWRGGVTHTRTSQVPIAGSWGADVVISTQLRYSNAGAQVQPISFAPGSDATDISWDGRIITANMAVGPTTHAGYNIDNGPPIHLYTALVNTGVTQVQGMLLQSAAAVSGDGRWVTGTAILITGDRQTYVARLPHVCGDIDFNNDGLYPDTQDIADFIAVFGGSPCPTGNCDSIDFNADGLFPDTNDIETLLRVFSGGPCLV